MKTFSEKLDEFIKDTAWKNCGVCNHEGNPEPDEWTHERIIFGANSLKPIVLKLANALRKYQTQSCSSQNINMAAKETLAEIEEILNVR